ncbi:MAG: hypothetical protein AABZ92_01130 [Verrucomicrobiota bacterium]
MDPINNCTATNEISPSYASSLAEKYGLTEQYSKDHPEDFREVFLLVQSFEDNFEAVERVEQALEKLSNSVTRLEEDNKILLAQQADLIESSEKNLQDLQNLKNSSSEMKEITSNIANFAKRFFNPVRNGMRNGFYFLTGHRVPAAILPRENPLAIECNPESTISNTDPINQSSVDEKKTLQIY